MGRRAVMLGLAVLAVLPSCAFRHIDLVQDHRVHITAPSEQQHVRLPVTIAWRTTGLRGQHFAVFVDRRVIKPGAALRSVASGDDLCLRRPSCPDDAYLQEHGVYVVDGDSLTLPFLADRHSQTGGLHADAHTVTVVILDGTRRSGESAFQRDFVIDR